MTDACEPMVPCLCENAHDLPQMLMYGLIRERVCGEGSAVAEEKRSEGLLACHDLRQAWDTVGVSVERMH
jgi:hypothetical protein